MCVYWIFQSCLLKMCATAGACINETGLFSSAAVVPRTKSTELWSSTAVVPALSKSTELCSSANVVPQSKSTAIWSSAAPLHHDLWYFRHRTNHTNEHFTELYVIYSGKTYEPAYSSATLKSLKATHSIKLLKKLLTWANTFHWRLWRFPWNVWEV